MEQEKMMETTELSRRGFLKTGAVFAGSMAIAGGVLGSLTSAANANQQQLPQYPWPYVQLDVEKAKEIGYKGYMGKQCCYGVFDSVMAQLRDKVGYPYTVLPSEIMIWGGTGGAGWASLCGALIGGATAINVVVGPSNKEVFPLVDELFSWACDFEFPQYMPPVGKAGKAEGKLPAASCGSVLCHVSVSTWCAHSKYRAESPQRSERCGRLSADVAAKVVEILNAYHAGKFVPGKYADNSVEDCMTCHGKGSSLENTRGKMDCVQCHDHVDTNNLIDHIKQQWKILR